MEQVTYGKYDISRISELEMRDLIFQALSEESPANTPTNETFKQYGYSGTINDLRTIVEYLAIQKGLVPSIVTIHGQAWGCPGEIPHYGTNSNFNIAENDVFNEVFYSLLYQNVIAVGSHSGFDLLPYFHVTTFGLKCLSTKEILPFDSDNYLAAINATHPDAWEQYYVSEALKCYNIGAYSASVMILGILGEYIAEQLIDAMDAFLDKNDPARHTAYHAAINKRSPISTKYQEYESALKDEIRQKDASGNRQYPQLYTLSQSFDDPAKAVYNTYVRLTRNDLVHPSKLQMERPETLMLFVSFVHYFKIQHQFLDELKQLSK